MKLPLLSLLFFTSFLLLGCNQSFQTDSSQDLPSNGTLGAEQRAQAKVKILDASGNPAAGVTVNGSWSGVVTGNTSAVTDSNGFATLVSAKSSSPGNYTLTVTSASGTGFSYDATKNKIFAATITK